MTFGLVHASYSLPEWQAVKPTFFAPWCLWGFLCIREAGHRDNKITANET